MLEIRADGFRKKKNLIVIILIKSVESDVYDRTALPHDE